MQCVVFVHVSATFSDGNGHGVQHHGQSAMVPKEAHSGSK